MRRSWILGVGSDALDISIPGNAFRYIFNWFLAIEADSPKHRLIRDKRHQSNEKADEALKEMDALCRGIRSSPSKRNYDILIQLCRSMAK